MKLYFVHVESTDWCGISEDYVVKTRDDQDETDIESHYDFLGVVEDAIREYLDEDDLDEDGFVGTSMEIEPFTTDKHGDPDCGAYHQYDISGEV